jgi:hypothetical protein
MLKYAITSALLFHSLFSFCQNVYHFTTQNAFVKLIRPDSSWSEWQDLKQSMYSKLTIDIINKTFDWEAIDPDKKTKKLTHFTIENSDVNNTLEDFGTSIIKFDLIDNKTLDKFTYYLYIFNNQGKVSSWLYSIESHLKTRMSLVITD